MFQLFKKANPEIKTEAKDNVFEISPEDNTLMLCVDKNGELTIKISIQNLETKNAAKFAEVLFLVEQKGYREMFMQMLQDMLTPEKTLEFSRVTNRIYVNMDWKTQTKIGEYLLFEAYKILDPNIYTEIYNDWLLKKYCTAIIKFQWGQNLSKYSGVALPGGVTMDASSIVSEARQEMQQIEEQIQSKYELPPEFMVG